MYLKITFSNRLYLICFDLKTWGAKKPKFHTGTNHSIDLKKAEAKAEHPIPVGENPVMGGLGEINGA